MPIPERLARVLEDLQAHGQSNKEQIAERVQVPVDTLRRHIADLRKAGYIQRHSDIEDPRRVSFSITKDGRAALRKSKS